MICSLPLTGRAISLGFHPHRQAGGVQPTVVYPVMGHHGPGGSKTFPGVAVGEDEILGAGGDSHPDAMAFPEANWTTWWCGSSGRRSRLPAKKLRPGKAITVSGAEQAIRQLDGPAVLIHVGNTHHKVGIRRVRRNIQFRRHITGQNQVFLQHRGGVAQQVLTQFLPGCSPPALRSRSPTYR